MSPAKVIPPKGRPFYLKNGEEIEHSRGFKRLSRELQKEIKWLGIFGTRFGAHFLSLDGRQGGGPAVELFKSKIVFKDSDEEGWISIKFVRNPYAGIFDDGTRIEPISQKEMDAELAARQKPSRREK